MTEDTLTRALWATARIAGAVALVGCAPLTIEENASYQPELTCDQVLDGFTTAVDDDANAINDADDATLDCCDDLVADVDKSGEWPTEPIAQDALTDCCMALDFPTGLACTPWGPPVPPAFA